MTNTVVRQATPADRNFLAWCILTATRSHLSKGWFDISLCRPESICLEFLAQLTVTTAKSPWHYSNFTIAQEVSGRPLAALGAARSPEAYKDTAIALLACMKHLGIDSTERDAFWKRGAYLFKCAFPPAHGSLVLEIAATLSECRKKGYVGTLIQHALAHSRSQGVELAETSCFIGNEPSQQTITRAGFLLMDEKRDSEFEAVAGAPGIRRFTMALQP